MILKLSFYFISLTTLCLGQDYTTFQNRNQQSTNTYSNFNSNGNNPFDPKRNRFNTDIDPEFKKQNGISYAQYDYNRNHYDPGRVQNDLSTGQYDVNTKYDPVKSSFDNRYDNNRYIPESTPKTAWENRYVNSGLKGAPLDHESLIINEA